MKRHIAAVIIGHVRLSQSDKEGTRACFLHEILEPAITAHRG